MGNHSIDEFDPRIQAALAELRGLIREAYPAARFDVTRGDDPEGIYLTATVDVDDAEEVVDVFLDRLLELQIEDGLPVYVIPVEPLDRVLEHLRASSRVASSAPQPVPAD